MQAPVPTDPECTLRDPNLAVVAVEAAAGSVAPLPMVVRQPGTSSDLELEQITNGNGPYLSVKLHQRR